ncbi:hypothetical protein C8R45DRAFT_1042290 [Mycena sanguinolenta]|nr:hypothetical protein C8R45DRAFT_1042290 [Mycena sanguinolenta]
MGWWSIAVNARHSPRPRGTIFSLSSTHPQLRQFSFEGSPVVVESDFLTRHPWLDSIFLETRQSFSPMSSSDNVLRALNIGQDSLTHSPSLIDLQITHLRFRDMYGFLNTPLLDAVRGLSRNVRCFEIDIPIYEDNFGSLPLFTVHLFKDASTAIELGIICHRRTSFLPPKWSSNMLTAVLTAIGPTASVRALRFCCSQALPEDRLHDLDRFRRR